MSRAAGRDRTKEHGIPRWVLPWLGDPEDYGVKHTIRAGMHGEVLREWTHETLDLVARRVCRSCNQGWMNNLERLARPHLTPLFEGQLRVLDAPTQRVVAAWAVKTALALALAAPPPRAVEPVHYRELARLQRRPPKNTHVWLGAYRGWRHAFHCPRSLTFTEPRGNASEGYAATFSVARPIFHVVGHSHADEISIIKGGIWPRATVKIWPVEGLAHWPTPMLVDDRGLQVLAET
jgi:hypothetical protein